MTNFNRGNVILVRFPNSDFRTYKKRPILIVQSDFLITGLKQKVIAPITSNLNWYQKRVALRGDSRGNLI